MRDIMYFQRPSKVSRECSGAGTPRLEFHKLKKVYVTHWPQDDCSPTDLRSMSVVSTDL